MYNALDLHFYKSSWCRKTTTGYNSIWVRSLPTKVMGQSEWGKQFVIYLNILHFCIIVFLIKCGWNIEACIKHLSSLVFLMIFFLIFCTIVAFLCMKKKFEVFKLILLLLRSSAHFVAIEVKCSTVVKVMWLEQRWDFMTCYYHLSRLPSLLWIIDLLQYLFN